MAFNETGHGSAEDFAPGQRVQLPSGFGTVTRVSEGRVYVRPDSCGATDQDVDMDADELRYTGVTLPVGEVKA